MAKKAAKKPAPKAAAKKSTSKPAPAPKAASKVTPKTAVKASPKNAVASKATAAASKKSEPPVAKTKSTPVVEQKTSSKTLKVVSRQKDLVVETEVIESIEVVEVVEKSPAAKKAAKIPKARAPKVDKGSGADDEKRWSDLYEKYKAEKASTYDMKATFAAGQPIQHKILGWGWILSTENDRLEVLFKDGKRVLISNYNPAR